MFEIQPGSFDSIVKIAKYLSVVQIVLWLVHLRGLCTFLENHSGIVNFLVEENFYRPFSISFALDSAILSLTVVSYLMKRELNNVQYLTDAENFVYLLVTIASLICSLGYLTCLVLFYRRNSVLSTTFSQKMGKEVADYPCGAMKPLIDRIQMKYGCCGVAGYEDWFSNKWLGKICNTPSHSPDNSECSSAGTIPHAICVNDQATSDDVPFSCCSDAIGIPCIHHKLLQDSHYVYFNHSNSTIWDNGCVAKFNEIYLVDLNSLTHLAIFITIFSILTALVDKTIQATDDSFSNNGKLCLGLFAPKIIAKQPSQQGSTPVEIEDANFGDAGKSTRGKIAGSISKSKTDVISKHVLTGFSSCPSSPPSSESNDCVKIMPNFKPSNGSNFPNELIRRSSRSLPSRASWSSSDRKRKSSASEESTGKRMKGLLC